MDRVEIREEVRLYFWSENLTGKLEADEDG